MSKLIVNALQIGQSPTPANNLYISPSGLNDGTFSIKRGNVGAPTQEILLIGGDGRLVTRQALVISGDDNMVFLRDGSYGGISFYDVKDPDLGVFNYTMRMDQGKFSWGFSTTNVVGDFGVEKTTLDYNGNFYTVGDITGLSDATTKHDIVTIDSAVEKVKQLRGVTFTRNADGVRSTGLLAQDVQAVLPEAVHTQDDGKLSLAYGNLVGLLVQAIKEQQVQLEQLQSQLSKGV